MMHCEKTASQWRKSNGFKILLFIWKIICSITPMLTLMITKYISTATQQSSMIVVASFSNPVCPIILYKLNGNSFHVYDEKFTVLFCLPKSLNLNPIEHIQDMLDEQFALQNLHWFTASAIYLALIDQLFHILSCLPCSNWLTAFY